MGMDVYGKDPANEVGKYFRASVWGWHPLATFITDEAPEEITSKVKYWHSNDGDGLGKRDSCALAKHLRAMLADGRAAAYVADRDAALAAAPDEVCRLCVGTGRRGPIPAPGQSYVPPTPENPGVMDCNGCNSTGKVRPNPTYYSLTVEDIEEFTAFLEVCGGFEIC